MPPARARPMQRDWLSVIFVTVKAAESEMDIVVLYTAIARAYRYVQCVRAPASLSRASISEEINTYVGIFHVTLVAVSFFSLRNAFMVFC